jgi:hypothetical protein
MKIHGVDHVAVGGILQMNVNGVANPNANERPRYFAIKSPVAEGRRFREPTFLFNSE